MKRSANKSFEDFPSVTLYLNDVREILNILTESCGEVKLQTGEYHEVEPEELDELVRNTDTDRFSDIYIRTSQPYISIDLRTFGVRIYISEDNTSQRGVVSKISDILNHRQRRHFGKVTNFLSALPAIGFGAFIVAGQYKYAAAMLLIVLLSIYPVIKYQINNKVVVLTEEKNTKQSFLKRKKDDLVIALVSGSFGAAISFALVKYFGPA
ncbi:hypothetical protein [Marinobacterium jannaschii]|uniref:hypothetical protein n=1 Tax=Marinobacterium jannaschii TaxID=64970 RepID=UPI0004855228|nr:hypothetical protein [Marinobacterium jannaschii]